MSRRTIRAWKTNSGEFLQVTDVRDIFYGNYSVEFEVIPGGLDSIYSSPNLEKCFKFVKKSLWSATLPAKIKEPQGSFIFVFIISLLDIYKLK